MEAVFELVVVLGGRRHQLCRRLGGWAVRQSRHSSSHARVSLFVTYRLREMLWAVLQEFRWWSLQPLRF